MYYLNAFNEMLRKRQRQNMMGGEGYQNDAAPSGPMGARQSGGGMAGVRNALSNPFVSFAASMIPAARAPFALARLGVSAYDDSQRASENAAMETARQGFQASEKAGYGPPGPEYGPPPVGTIDPSAYEGAMSTNSFPAGSMGGTANYSYGDFGDAAMAAPTSVVGEPISRTNLSPTTFTGEAYTPLSLPSYSPNATDSYGGAIGGDASGVTGGYGEGGGGGFGGTYNQGGMVNAQHLMGRAPAPDDGYGALQGGEYVITKAAVEKYGKRLLDAINNGTFR